MNTATQHNHYNDSTDIWDIEIEPRQSLSQINIKELWRYRDLMMLMVKRDFAAKYKQTILGPAWHFVQPLLTTAINVFMFNVMAKIGTDNKNIVLFQMASTIIWNYFSVCLVSTSTTFVTNANIFGKVYFPRLVSPLSIVISSIIQFIIQLMLLVFTMIFYFTKGDSSVHVGALWVVPLIVVIMAGIGLGLGIIISSLTTKYRDLTVLVAFGVQLLMFASAVPYPLSELEKRTQNHHWLYQLVKWNPLSVLTDSFRNAMLGGPINWYMLGYSTCFMIAAIFFGSMIFNKVEKTFMDTV